MAVSVMELKTDEWMGLIKAGKANQETMEGNNVGQGTETGKE